MTRARDAGRAGRADHPATIAAIASPPGPGARGVIRLSGERTADLVRATCDVAELGERGLHPARFDDGRGEQPVIVLWMPGPRSFTREDVAELHLPGAPPLLRAALARLYELGAEPAAPGEFTRRAFENGRIDLTRAEGVLELVHARNGEERRAATALVLGGLDERMAALREGLDALRALAEASLDFDESDTGHVPTDELVAGAAAIHGRLVEALEWEERRSPATGAPRVVLAGRPNAGKSALFNRLVVDRDPERGGRAIVSDLAGTTRDGKGAAWDLSGVPCLLLDTAGVDPGARGADGVAQSLAAGERRSADLVLWVVDATGDDRGDGVANVERPEHSLVVWNKLDLADARPAPDDPAVDWVGVSARTGRGVDELERRVAERLGLAGGDAGPVAAGSGIVRELGARHRAALASAAAELERARAELSRGLPLDLFAEALRAATAELDRIQGRTSPEDLLDRIFARFCVGK